MCLFLGSGTWQRSRICMGDFKDTCIGPATETEACDVADCIPECEGNPCNNDGRCRSNTHLARLYNCKCPDGWIGKHCDFAGPHITCEADAINLEMDHRVLYDESLPTDSKYVALSGFIDVPECTSVAKSRNSTDVLSLNVPTPLDISCGSEIEIDDDEIRIKNQVEWRSEDGNIEAKVILFAFACAYKTTLQVTGVDGGIGNPLPIESFKRSIEIINGSLNFEVVITLFRDSNFKLPIRAEFGSLMRLAEGQIVYVAVDLKQSEVTEDAGVYLVMNTCFVTSSLKKNNTLSNRKPILYLLKNRCPSSPFVKVLSNGEGKTGLLSVRIFGWTKKNIEAENMFLHCTVEVCQDQVNDCKPICESNLRKRRDVQQKRTNEEDYVSSSGMEVHKYYPSITQTVEVGQPLISSTIRDEDINTNYMVSAGPISVQLIV